MFALPCLVTKSGRATSSATVSSSPRGTGAGGDGGGGVFGLLRLGAGGVGGLCGDLSRPVETCAGPCRHGRLWGSCACAVRGRFRRIGTGVHTLRCPRWQQWRTPLCLRVHLGHGGRPCSGHSCSCGLRATWSCVRVWGRTILKREARMGQGPPGVTCGAYKSRPAYSPDGLPACLCVYMCVCPADDHWKASLLGYLTTPRGLQPTSALGGGGGGVTYQPKKLSTPVPAYQRYTSRTFFSLTGFCL